MTKTLILDTNVYLTEAQSLFSFGRSNIAVPTIILDEIDKHKHRQDTAGFNARLINKILDKLRSKGSLINGVSLGRGKGKIFVSGYDPEYMPKGINADDSDNKILAVALKLNSSLEDVAVVSRDINLRVKCDAHGIESVDYNPKKVVRSVSSLYTGCREITVEDSLVEKFYSGDKTFISQDLQLKPHEFLTLRSGSDPKKTAFGRFVSANEPLRKLNNFKDIWGLKARNKEQKFAMNLLFDSDIDIVTLTGPAGTGKTLIAAACGLEQVLGYQEKPKYDKLIITRPVQPVGRDIGFLPGTLEEKMLPWVAPLKDNLEYLFGDKTALEMNMEQGVIEIEAMSFIRGRSISKAFMIVDEAQNLTAHELKTIITRAGDGTKIVLTGDVQQIDNSYVDSVSNGLTYAVEKFKDHSISGHITLLKGERSRLATLAADIL